MWIYFEQSLFRYSLNFKENGVAIVNMDGDKAVDEDRSGVFAEGRVKIGNVAWNEKYGGRVWNNSELSRMTARLLTWRGRWDCQL